MANEELTQRKYLDSGALKGDPFGDFEELNIGATSVAELVRAGVHATPPASISYPFKHYKAPKKPASVKPDRVFLQRQGNKLRAVAVSEQKASGKLRDQKDIIRASEQGLFAAAALGASVAVTTNGVRYTYIDVAKSLASGEICCFPELRDLNPAVLRNLILGDAGEVKDPKSLAETVWQIIWHATKEDPKPCLLTFVEIFVLKFLSDNLPKTALPDAFSFYELAVDTATFERKHGVTAIEYYVSTIRPHVKKLFPDNVIAHDKELAQLFGLSTVVSKTSIINGFAFLRTSKEPLAAFNRTFLEILCEFKKFGPLTAIDPEFKLRLYETFLKRSARQQKLGQFFTPRNVVRQMIRMAELSRLPDGAVVLDPAAGVGGFVLEPLLISDALPGNVRFERGVSTRRVKTIGVDVDANTHILAKANMLIHLAEELRNPTTTLQSLNCAMAETFVLMDKNQTLGALENPPRDAVDVIMTNPPYVTKGSGIYKKELDEIKGQRNGLALKNYYSRWGLGVESLFLRYISGSLKPGGRAFVIVPLGMLIASRELR